MASPAAGRNECPIDAVLRLLMGPWTTYILYILRTQGPRRFGELKREVGGISAKVLTERLRMLEDARLVHRDYQATIPPQVTYSLAPRGAELNPMLDTLRDIALRWQKEDAQGAVQGAAKQAAE
jgi:DNA-binding HxlR family transcriptional regulator